MTSEKDLRTEHRQRILAVHQKLHKIYGEPQWRGPLPPIDELVSTFLSQNTNDQNRDKAFGALKQRYHSWEAVRDAPTPELVEVIRSAGLANQKAPRIQNALRVISQHQGEISLDFLRDMPVEQARNWLKNLKGVGPKTAAIVLLFSMGIPAFPVDTHIYRVTGRIGARPLDINVEKTHEYLEEIVPEDAYYALHLNLIRLGRETCQARKWYCWRCPIESLCLFDKKLLQKSDK